MAKRGPKPKAKAPEPVVKEIVETLPVQEARALQPTYGQKRDGGKAALAAESQELAMRQEEQIEKSERDKLGDKYMEENYGTPEEELSQPEETPPTSVEELSQENTEEAAPEEEQEEVQPEEETVPISQLKDTQDKMHQATSEAANYRKLFEEITPYVDWSKYQLSTQGKGEVPATATKPREEATQELFVSDYPKWKELTRQEVKAEIIEDLKREFMPQAANQLTAQTEWKRLEAEFRNEFKDVFGDDTQEAIDLMNVYITRARKENPKASPQELFDKAKPNFQKRFGLGNKKTGKKVVPLESPQRAKESAPSPPAKEMTMADWETESRKYVDFRQKKLRELQSR